MVTIERSTMQRTAPIVARILLGLIFALSATAKLSASGIFQADVAAYHILPSLLVGPFALTLPWVEAVLALYLLERRSRIRRPPIDQAGER